MIKFKQTTDLYKYLKIRLTDQEKEVDSNPSSVLLGQNVLQLLQQFNAITTVNLVIKGRRASWIGSLRASRSDASANQGKSASDRLHSASRPAHFAFFLLPEHSEVGSKEHQPAIRAERRQISRFDRCNRTGRSALQSIESVAQTPTLRNLVRDYHLHSLRDASRSVQYHRVVHRTHTGNELFAHDSLLGLQIAARHFHSQHHQQISSPASIV